jgi:serine/threonine protein kinase/Flp pilus assembly protein TadD
MTPERYEQIGRLYQSALEREPTGRAAFLTEACGADDELRREVESLIAASEQVGDFIEQPPDDVAAAWQVASALPQSGFGHYRMLSLLGRGGMGEVWLAEDTQLSRKVAIKLLPAEFTTQPERVRRFAQEARAASALNHPNIITVHEIGETDSTHYIVTEHVEGETLRQQMNAAPEKRMPPTAAVAVAAQIAAALAAAHEAGIVHRDIKPENVMVRRDGYVKVLDFGLARVTEPVSPVIDSPGTTLSTDSGIVMGTPRYMAPEQARGERVDGGADLWSLGVMLYEMLAGRGPFAGTTPGEMIASILRDEPLPLTEAAPDVPPELARIVSQALQKKRAERYQTAQALLADLKQLQRELEIASAEKSPGRKEWFGTPRKWRRAAIVVLAGLLIAAMVVWFYFRRQPVLTDKDTILLADFENRTGEEFFDQMLRQGLEIQLQQSPFLNLFPDAQARQELRLMQRALHERVTAELAREICVRKNLKAFITGSIAPLGSHYVITLTAVNGQSSAVISRTQVEAEKKEQVLRALSQAAAQLREALGENLSLIQLSNQSLEEVTTTDLEAFRFYAQGAEQALRGNSAESLATLQRAVERDPQLGMAWSLMAVMHSNFGQPELAAECAARAYAVRDRLSEREKMRITYWYHRFVTGNLPQQLETVLLQQRLFPGTMDRGNIDLGLTYFPPGQFEQAAAAYRESIRLMPAFLQPYRFLAWSLLRLNRFAEAEETTNQALRLNAELADLHVIQYHLAFIKGDVAEMQRQNEWARGTMNEHLASDWQAQAEAFKGRWRQSQESARRAIDLAARAGMKELAARYATEQALRGAIFGACRQAKPDAARGLQFFRSRIALPRAALALALCGEADQAQPLVTELSARYPEDTLIHFIWLPVIRAAIELQHDNAAQAIEKLQAATRYEAAAEFWPQFLRGQAYLKLGRGAEAAAEFQKILDHRGHAPLSPMYPLAHSGLARAAALTGDVTQRRQAYKDFLALWKEADSDLPVLTQTKLEFEVK